MEAHTHQPTVLIADDDGPTLDLYANVLSHNYHVLTCSTWQDAMEILSTHRPQIIVLEPSIAGYRAWELLKEIVRLYAASVIICSALDERRYGLEAGAAAYLVKPVLPSTLLETLKSILG
jgi:DNA-binding response OmpR family regulator